MVSAGSYVVSAVLLAVLVLSLSFSAVLLRRRLLPEWEGAPAHLVDAIVGVALLIWLSELLGVLNLFYAWALVAASVALAAGIAFATERGGAGGPSPAAGFFAARVSLSPSGLGEKHDAATGEGPLLPFQLRCLSQSAWSLWCSPIGG